MKELRIHIRLWNAETGTWEWLNFSSDDIEDLLYYGIINVDALGYAMKDNNAFNKAFSKLCNRAYSYNELVAEYLDNTDFDINIVA